MDFDAIPNAHPDLVSGTLPTGLQYTMIRHTVPRGRMSLALRVQAGSADEDSTERGLAHFAEHVAFDSSLDHPTRYGVWQELQSHGAEINAFTTPRSTVFMFANANATDDQGRRTLRFARQLLLRADPKQDYIDVEKGVVLGEFRERNT